MLQTYHIKREVWFGGTKLNGVNCRRLMEKNEEIINSLRDILIEMKKVTVSDDDIHMYCDKHKHIFTEMNNTYRCIKTLKIMD